MQFDNIDFLNGAREFTVISEGHSDALKYSFLKDGIKYFLKIGTFKIYDELDDLLTEAKIKHPKILEWGKLDDEHNYIIEKFVEGDNMKYRMDSYEGKFLYEFGFKIGKSYGNLRKKFPDMPVSQKFVHNHRKAVNERITTLLDVLQTRKRKLGAEHLEFIDFLIDYLRENFFLIEESIFVFGHTDVKPSNFVLHKRELYATDFEHTDYKELSLALLWAYARNDKKDVKHIFFTRGYLDGLYNLGVSENILKAFNYTYMYNMANYCIDYLRDERYDALNKLITNIKNNYVENGTIILDEKLRSFANVHYFPQLNGYDFTLVDSSYDAGNLTFKCSNGEADLFLKIMNMSQKKFDKIIESYKLLESVGIPTSPVRDCGVCRKDECYYVLFDFIEYEQLGKNPHLNSFEDGIKYGEMCAKYWKKIKGKRIASFSTFDKKKLYEDIIERAQKIYHYDDWSQYLKWPYEELVGYLDALIDSYDDEKIDIVHRDLKFGNILSDGEDKLIFVDNESLMYSYDIMNFLYNMQNGFKYEGREVYQGYVNGYLKYMNDGVIPERIEKQAKVLLLYFLIRTILSFLEKTGKSNEIEDYMALCDEYIARGKRIEWLQ